MPYGETVKGEYSPVAANTAGFGSIYNEVFGANAAATTGAASKGRPGKLLGYGAQGTQIKCEYYRNGATGHATGACSTSTGFLYRLQY